MTPVAHSSAVLAYDAYGNRTSRMVRSLAGETTEERRSYDKYGRLVEIASFGTSVKYRYDAKGRIARQTVDGSPIDFAYTKYGLLAGKYLGGREKPDAAVEYEYSKSGQVVARTANGVRQTYEYDGRGQLLAVKENGADVERYVYDKAGNMVKKTLRLGGAHTSGAPQYQITTFTFDGAKTYTYGYHVDGQLARADYGKTDGNGGRAGCPQPAGSEDFLWDGLALIKRGDERFVNEPHVGGGNPVASSKGTTYFNDILGTAVGAKQGRKYSAAALTAFGEAIENRSVRSTPTPSTYTSFYTGKPHVTGLGHAFLFRNYCAGLAKWQTADPFGYPDGWNRLAYCGNEVISGFDYKGGQRTENEVGFDFEWVYRFTGNVLFGYEWQLIGHIFKVGIDWKGVVTDGIPDILVENIDRQFLLKENGWLQTTEGGSTGISYDGYGVGTRYYTKDRNFIDRWETNTHRYVERTFYFDVYSSTMVSLPIIGDSYWLETYETTLTITLKYSCAKE